MNEIPVFRKAHGEKKGAVVMAFDVEVGGVDTARIDAAASAWTDKNFDVVVLVGNRFDAFPLPRRGEISGIDGEVGKISAQAVYNWVQENMPDAHELIFAE